MKHSKAVVISGFERGGTGVVWNILQSHPQLCSPILETGEILFGAHLRWAPKNFLRGLYLRSDIMRRPVIGRFLFNLTDYWLYMAKLRNYKHYQNGEKYDGILYTKEEIKQATICLKSVNYEIYLNDLFKKYYENAYFIGLVRNGYAICNGWVRRGHSAEKVGKVYSEIGKTMIEYHKSTADYMVIKFEDVLKRPFSIAEDLFSFCKLDPVNLDKLRLKSTKTLSSRGEHATSYGREQTKYWFDRDKIFELLDPDINKRQKDSLSTDDRIKFEKEAGEVLDYFGYELDES